MANLSILYAKKTSIVTNHVQFISEQIQQSKKYFLSYNQQTQCPNTVADGNKKTQEWNRKKKLTCVESEISL